ncbi:MAG TPA: Rrf2 family transcriptional regulator [Acidobacteriota bacterium]|jgi:Rrf2 family protein|nr:Rrf2 family transcriptional regulator [Acidobacteriota bacterium]HRV07891.1 Rrf2 family transcriptional regulator [Acidobacteriota bacterium]
MRFSARTAYAGSAILELASLYGTGPVKARDIADRQGVPLKFLEQILRQLRAAGLVESSRGPEGGFSLARPPSQVSLRQVVEAVEGDLRLLDLDVGDPTLRTVWEDLQKEFRSRLERISLQDLVDMRRRQGAIHFDI